MDITACFRWPHINLDLVGAFGFLIGVAIFAYVMGNFLDVMIVMKDINEDLEDGNGLANFIGMLKNFNKGDPISIKLKEHQLITKNSRIAINRQFWQLAPSIAQSDNCKAGLTR